MTDPLNPIFKSAEQKSFHELRSEFREENRKRIARTLREDVLTFRDKAGYFLRHADGTLVKKKTGYLTDAPEDHIEHRRLDDWLAGGGAIPEPSNEFNILGWDIGHGNSTRGLYRELADLSRDAAAMEKSETVQHPHAPSLEGPPVDSLDESALLDYTEKLVKDE